MSGVPKGWTETTLGATVDFNPKHAQDMPRGLAVSFVPMAGLDEKLGVIATSEERPLIEVWKGYTHFANNDVLFAKITPCMENGKAAVARGLINGVGCGSTEFHVLRSNGSIEPNYVWNFVRQSSFRKSAERKMTGAVGQRRVPLDHLRMTTVPIPPLSEQRRIVAKIDRLSSRSRRAREELERAAKLVTRFKEVVLASAFNSNFSGKPREFVPIQHYLSERIRNGLSVAGSDMPPGIRALKLSALKTDTVDLSDVRYLDIGAQRAASFVLEFGDLLVSRGNGSLKFVGKAAVVPEGCEDTIFPDTAFRLRPEKSLADPRWLCWMWNAPQMRQKIEATARTTAGIWKISQSDISTFVLPDVGLREQREIVRRIEHAFAAIDRLAAEAASAQKLLDRLDQAVLAKAFRGELVPQDPNDEPASVLLERIRSQRAAAPAPKRGHRKKAAQA